MRIAYLLTATTGSLVTNLKILRRYLDAFVRHITFRKLLNIARVEWAYWFRRTRVKGYPYILKIESTNICNLRCPFCLDRDRDAFKEGRGFGRMTLEQFKRIVDTLGPYTLRINLYGSGEPVLFPEIYDMIAYAASKNIGVAISANLSSFDPKNVDRLLTCGLEHLIISCHGATEKSYLKYNVGGNFEKVMKNMRLIVRRRKELKQRTPFIDWQFLLFSHNEHEVPLARKLAKEIGVDIIRFILPNIPPEHKEAWRPRGGAKAPEKERASEAPEAGGGDPKVTENGSHTTSGTGESAAGETPPRENAPRPSSPGDATPAKKPRIKLHRCSWVYRSIFFNWDGGILPCCHEQVDDRHDFGKLEDLDDFQGMWNDERYRQARDMAHFRVHPACVPLHVSCVNCPMPKLPFILHEKGFPLSKRLARRIAALSEGAPSLIEPPGPEGKT